MKWSNRGATSATALVKISVSQKVKHSVHVNGFTLIKMFCGLV